MIRGAACLRRNRRSYPALVFSRRIDRAGYSANIFYGVDVLNRQKIQIALTKGDAIFPRIGKIPAARQSKPRSGTAFNDRTAYYQHRSDSDDRLLRHVDRNVDLGNVDLGNVDLGHVDLGHVDLAWLPDAKVSKRRRVLNSNGREV